MTLLMSVLAAVGVGIGPGSIKVTTQPLFCSSIAAVMPNIPAPATMIRSFTTHQNAMNIRKKGYETEITIDGLNDDTDHRRRASDMCLTASRYLVT